MSKIAQHRDFLDYLARQGLTEFGSVIEQSLVHELLGIELPDVGTQRQFRDAALTELAAVDYCRNALLNEGKYIGSIPSGYRILLPSENAEQVETYISQADKKLSRALKLSRNTPQHNDSNRSETQQARMLMKQSGIQRRFKNGGN